VEHYHLPVGQLREGDPADFIRVADLRSFKVLETWIEGQKVAENGVSLLPRLESSAPNQFAALPKKPSDFALSASAGARQIRVIEALDGQIVTGSLLETPLVQNGLLCADPARDLLKIAVVNRYTPDAPPAVGFVRGFGLRKGAVASSVAHDSHNIVVVGTDDAALCAAVNAVIECRGGISAVDGAGQTQVLPLPIAGLMSQTDGYQLARDYGHVDAWTKETLGCTLRAPFMLLSFLALPVIPALKMTDLGLFDVGKFGFTAVEAI
jgi:adenine deaminase